MKKEDKQLLITAGVALLAYFGIIKPILNKVGITKSVVDRKIEEQQQLPNNVNPFSSQFYKLAPAGSLLLTSALANMYAKRIYDALGFFSDDEAAIYSVFRALKTQTQVSFLAEKFREKYGSDLLEYMKRGYSQLNPASGLNADELNVVLKIVNGLPKYKV